MQGRRTSSTERLFSFSGLTLSDPCKYLLEGYVRDDHVVQKLTLNFVIKIPYCKCTVSIESLCQSFRTVVRTEFLDTTINNSDTGQETQRTLLNEGTT